HPDIEARLLAEITLVKGDGMLQSRDLEKLPLLRQIISETLRLYPPVWTIARKIHQPQIVRGYTLPIDATLLMSQWVVHHDQRWYPEPDRCKPDRWNAASMAARPKFAYFPFGGGPRLCLGESFVWVHVSLIIATLLPHWRSSLIANDLAIEA